MGGEGRESAGKDVDVERNHLCANEGCHERERVMMRRGNSDEMSERKGRCQVA